MDFYYEIYISIYKYMQVDFGWAFPFKARNSSRIMALCPYGPLLSILSSPIWMKLKMGSGPI